MSTFLKNLKKDPNGNFTYTNDDGAQIRVPASSSKAQALSLVWDACQESRPKPKPKPVPAPEIPQRPPVAKPAPKAAKNLGRPGDDKGVWGKLGDFFTKLNPFSKKEVSASGLDPISAEKASKQRVTGAYAPQQTPTPAIATASAEQPVDSNISQIEETENGYSILFEDGVEAEISAESPAGKKIAMALQMVRQIDQNIEKAHEGILNRKSQPNNEIPAEKAARNFEEGVEPNKHVKGELVMLGFSRSGAPMFGVTTNGTTIPLPAVGVEAQELKKILDLLGPQGGKVNIEGDVKPMDVLQPEIFTIEAKDGKITEYGWDTLTAQSATEWNFMTKETAHIADPITHEPVADLPKQAEPEISSHQEGEDEPLPEEPGVTIDSSDGMHEYQNEAGHQSSPPETKQATEQTQGLKPMRKRREPIPIPTHQEEAEKEAPGMDI